MDQPFLFHVYLSSAVRPFSNEEIVALLTRCRENNAKVGITGMLLYKEGNFMQVVEGAEKHVRELLEKITRDPRHHGLITLIEGRSAERQFPDWTMGFRDLNSDVVKQLPGYSEFLNVPLSGAEFRDQPTRCQKLLLTFKKNAR